MEINNLKLAYDDIKVGTPLLCIMCDALSVADGGQRF